MVLNVTQCTREQYPHEESNLDQLLRRQLLYPLSYGGGGGVAKAE